MNCKKLLIQEFEKRVFEESYDRIYTCFKLLSDGEVWHSPNASIPSIGNLVLHLCGNSRQWIFSGIGGEKDNRNRPQEFAPHVNIKKSELVFLLESIRVKLRNTLQEMPENMLEKELSIQGFDVTGFSAIVHVIEHFSYHTGQVVTITKWMKNKETNFYKDSDLTTRN